LIAPFSLFASFLSLLCLNFPNEKSVNTFHPTYVSVAEINYDHQNNYATLVCKTFTDDLANALQKRFSTKYNLNTGIDGKVSSQIDAYIKEHLQIKINGNIVPFTFQNYKQVDNTIVSGFIIKNVKGISQFEITDTIFYELFDTEIQIIYVTVNGNKKFSSIRNPESSLSFAF